MNRQKQYLADNVDAKGNVFPTVGENIRYGVKELQLPDIIRGGAGYLTIHIDNKGDITTSFPINLIVTKNMSGKYSTIIFPKFYAISSPIMFANKFTEALDYDVFTLICKDDCVGLDKCPFKTSVTILIGMKLPF